eukprot:TRINITY_DN35600_c0_g1_i4.p2 TRINITY_DN35600_c0_g1~~TRINITY_DN35600_c0_g1_i4.p2  ORF type:complete len:105 (+),score=29.99 TRINITY_DN35600_c0_g1_i4:38-352(+)
MSGDSFSELIKTEKEAADIIKTAKDARRQIMKDSERSLEKEIEQYKVEEQNRIRSEQQAADANDGDKGKEGEAETSDKIKDIQAKTNANTKTMVKTLLDMVTTV